MTLVGKIEGLKRRLKGYGKVAVAFSGGKDSFFLLKIAVETLGKERVAAFFVETPFGSLQDRKRLEYFRNRLDFNLEKISLVFGPDENMMKNPRDRCYFCKKKIFRALKEAAAALGAEAILDGTTASDLQEYRPGLKALEELDILSPLEGENISSGEIQQYLERAGIEPFYLTSSTCLATRFPYGLSLSKDLLRRFDRVEFFLTESGIYPVKVRYIEEGIRIETTEEHFGRVLALKEKLIDLCIENQFKFVTLDLGGIKSGVWD